MTDTKSDALTQMASGSTCFATHARHRLPCLKETCKLWINSECNHNCTLIATAMNMGCAMTLQEIGDIYDLTRMRVCQIEKRAIEKVKDVIFEGT